MILRTTTLITILLYSHYMQTSHSANSSQFNEIEFLVRLGSLTNTVCAFEKTMSHDNALTKISLYRTEVKILIAVAHFAGIAENNSYMVQARKLDEIIERHYIAN